MSEEPKVERSIADELSKLGKQLAEAVKAAWESEDRKKLQAEIAEGFQKLSQEVSEAVEKASESETAKELREKAEKMVEEIREADVVEEVRKGILAGLDVLNRELGKLLEKLETRPAAEPAPEAPAEPPAPAGPPAEAPEAPTE
ncbi:MAG: hypothetical protein N2204_04400 [Anaerolineae bacterium]|nr:hypothetical protein [Anaerolineae bacterium]